MNEKARVLELLRSRALMKGVQVTLASGQTSSYYIDCKKVTLHGPSLAAVSRAFLACLREADPSATHVAGVSVGGDPLVAGVTLMGFESGWELGGLLVRKEKKGHGLSQGRAVDGVLASETGSVWLLEDVVSTGGSSLTAARHLRSEGYPLKGMLCLVDRQMGGVEHLRQELGIPVFALLKVDEILG